MSFTTFVLKKIFRFHDKKRDNGLIDGDLVESAVDIVYGNDLKNNVLDVYRPKGKKGKLPVIVSVHGGGWIYGDKECYKFYCKDLARRGFAVVNFSYRLAPKFKFPAQLHDVDAAFLWVKENAEKYGFDPDNVFAVGDSAGANLLCIYYGVFNDEEYVNAVDLPSPKGFFPKALALNCGVYRLDDLNENAYLLRLLKAVFKNKGTKEELRLLSPLHFLDGGFPPAFVMTCKGDFAERESPALVEKLKSLGVPVTYKYYVGNEKPLFHVFHLDVRSEVGRKCNDDECDFFRSFINY